jgi:hypothetical protein
MDNKPFSYRTTAFVLENRFRFVQSESDSTLQKKVLTWEFVRPPPPPYPMLSGWVGASSAIIKFPDHPSTLVAGGAGGGQEYCRVNLTIYQVNTFFWRRGFVFGQVYSSGAEFRKIRIEPPLKAEIFSRFTGAYYRGATQRCCTLKERQLGCTLEEGARRARAAPRKINPSLLHWKWNQPMPNLESLKHGLIIINHISCASCDTYATSLRAV